MSLGQASAITTAVGDLPDDVPADVRDRAEAELVSYAERFDAQQLTRLGSHILTVVAPEIGEARDAEAWNGKSSGPGYAGSSSSLRTGTAPSTCGAG